MRNTCVGAAAVSVLLFVGTAQAQTSPGAMSPTEGAGGSSPPPQGSALPQLPSQTYTTDGRAQVPNYGSGAGQPPGSGRGDQRVQDLKYWACNGLNFLPRYDARWSETQFVLSRIDGGDTHTDAAINFVDWNMRCWSANWDAKDGMFRIKRLPSEEDEHTDNAIHFLAHDLTPWEGYRDEQGGWIVRPGRFEAPAAPTAGYGRAPTVSPYQQPTAGGAPYLGY